MNERDSNDEIPPTRHGIEGLSYGLAGSGPPTSINDSSATGNDGSFGHSPIIPDPLGPDIAELIAIQLVDSHWNYWALELLVRFPVFGIATQTPHREEER